MAGASAAKDMLRPLARTLRNGLREAALYPAILAPRARPRVVFLPSDVRKSTMLLRCYNMADALRAKGWNAIVLPKQLNLEQRRRLLRLFKPDLGMLMGSRHADNSRHLLAGIPFVYDLDDGDFYNPQIVDRVRDDVTHAAGVVAGSRHVAQWRGQFNDNLTVIWTGSPDVPSDWPPQKTRGQIVTWAQTTPTGYRPEFTFVTQVMEGLAARRSGLVLRLYNCSPEDAHDPLVKRLQKAGIDVQLKPLLAYPEFIASLREAAVGLTVISPESDFGKGKSFGKVLAYISAGVPVVASDAADHAVFFQEGTGVVSNDPQEWMDRIGALLDDPAARDKMALAAHADFRESLTTEAAADKLDAFCKEILNKAGG